MKATFTLTVIISLLIISFSIFYYLVIYLPQRDENIEQQKISKLKLVESCMQEAKTKNIDAWNYQCEKRGLDFNCSLSEKEAKYYSDILNKEIDNCKFYSQ